MARAAGVAMSCMTDHSASLRLLVMFCTQNTAPPAVRSATAKRFTAGTTCFAMAQ